jgi:hypothetical protein
MEELDRLKKELDECKAQKLFYYNSWKAEVQKNVEIEELIEEGSLSYTNPPLYAKLYKVIYDEEYDPNSEDESAAK